METNSFRPYDSILIGKYILSFAYNQGVPLNMTQIQKILFICYGYFLAKKKINLVDESPKAWPFGPVFPKTQKKIKLGVYTDLGDSFFDVIDKDVKIEIDKIVNLYKGISASRLSDWSHEGGSPWDKTTKLENFKWNNPIPDQFTLEYFSNLEVIG